jgi:glycine dehydrogenase subunit 1
MEKVYPYMPNTAPAVQKAMLDELGVEKISDLYDDLIPERLRYRGKMNLPLPLEAEANLKREIESILSKNDNTAQCISFLGAGCYRHHVPAVCDEINGRAEFLTAYVGDTYSDHGKLQALFEYASLMGELLDMDVVSYPTFDEAQAVSSSLRMAARITGRSQVLIPATIHPEIAAQIQEYCGHALQIQKLEPLGNGTLDLDDLEEKLSDNTAAVLLENPSFLGFLEPLAQAAADLAHRAGALLVVNARPSTLGILQPPVHYGADIVCGDIQPLGMHIQFGGGQAGYIATKDEERFIRAFPTYLYGIMPTNKEGFYGWGRALNERTSHGSREKANEYFGTGSALWAITTAVYLASMGPQGMKELGEVIMQRTAYAARVLDAIDGVRGNYLGTENFQEFLVNYDEIHMTAADVNRALLQEGIFGGKDMSADFPQYGQSALFSITELTTQADIDRLAAALKQIVNQGGGQRGRR